MLFFSLAITLSSNSEILNYKKTYVFGPLLFAIGIVILPFSNQLSRTMDPILLKLNARYFCSILHIWYNRSFEFQRCNRESYWTHSSESLGSSYLYFYRSTVRKVSSRQNILCKLLCFLPFTNDLYLDCLC